MRIFVLILIIPFLEASWHAYRHLEVLLEPSFLSKIGCYGGGVLGGLPSF